MRQEEAILPACDPWAGEQGEEALSELTMRTRTKKPNKALFV